MNYYRSNITGRLISGSMLHTINDIYGKGTTSKLIEEGTLIRVKNPTIIDCLRDGNYMTAVARYREIHGCNSFEARQGVEALKKDIARHTKVKSHGRDENS